MDKLSDRVMALEGLDQEVLPRRRVVVKLQIGADSWEELRGIFRGLETRLVVDGRLSATCISGGYSSGYIMESNEDESITHDSWAEANEAYCASLKAQGL